MIIASRRSRFARFRARKSRLGLIALAAALILGLAVVPVGAEDVPGLGRYSVSASPGFCEENESCSLVFTITNTNDSLDVLTVATITAPANFQVNGAAVTPPPGKTWTATPGSTSTLAAASPGTVNGLAPGESLTATLAVTAQTQVGPDQPFATDAFGTPLDQSLVRTTFTNTGADPTVTVVHDSQICASDAACNTEEIRVGFLTVRATAFNAAGRRFSLAAGGSFPRPGCAGFQSYGQAPVFSDLEDDPDGYFVLTHVIDKASDNGQTPPGDVEVCVDPDGTEGAAANFLLEPCPDPALPQPGKCLLSAKRIGGGHTEVKVRFKAGDPIDDLGGLFG